MPQLNPEFFLSQVFWLIITFSFLLIFLWRISLPRINLVLEKRENKIKNDIQVAKDLQTEAEEIQAKIDSQLVIAQEKVAKLIKETQTNLQVDVTNKLKETDIELAKKINESVKIVEKNKNETLNDIQTQIQEITKLVLSKLTTLDVSDKDIYESIKNIQINKVN